MMGIIVLLIPVGIIFGLGTMFLVMSLMPKYTKKAGWAKTYGLACYAICGIVWYLLILSWAESEVVMAEEEKQATEQTE
ncbi:MAG: hypothetical protein HOG49_12905 [Candidatus Scalindua sp.]|jgi:tellurite resistance protein TehA-like permease|nr:hypothetical protein [Candidatus Scalindua sp.]